MWLVGLLPLVTWVGARCEQASTVPLLPKTAFPAIRAAIVPTESTDLGDLMEVHISKFRLTVPKGSSDVWCELNAKSKHNGRAEAKVTRVLVASSEPDKEQICNVTLALLPLGESWSDATNYKWRVMGKSGAVNLGRQRVQTNPFHALLSVNWDEAASQESNGIVLMGGSSVLPSSSMEMVEQADFAVLSCRFVLVPKKPTPKTKMDVSDRSREDAEFENGR